MPAHDQHIVRKVYANVHLPEHEHHKVQSQRLSEAVQKALNNLEPVLNTVPGNVMLYIDQLAIDVTLPEWDPKRIEEIIRSELAEKLEHIIHSRAEKGKADDEARRSFSEEKQHDEILSSFLKTGRLPWWATSRDFAASKEYLNKLSPGEWIRFIGSIEGQSQTVLKRYVKQWSMKEVNETIRKISLARGGSELIFAVLNGVLKVSSAFRDSNKLDYSVEQRMLEIVLRALVYNHNDPLIAKQLIHIWLKRSTVDPNRQEKMLRSLKKYLESEDFKIFSDGVFEDLFPQIPAEEEGDYTRWEERQKRMGQTDDQQSRSQITESIPVQYAGAVLLHSFLPRLFKRLGYLENDRFRDQKTRERAVCAIFYLSTGRLEFPDEELTVAKFLCGWSADEPVSRYLQFSDYEREECDHLLSSVLSHWKALKNTSADGLRTSFLQREGILKKEAFGYTLYLEELTHDILLDRLPWSYSVVKLPWMDEMLSVQWRTS